MSLVDDAEALPGQLVTFPWEIMVPAGSVLPLQTRGAGNDEIRPRLVTWNSSSASGSSCSW